MEIVHKLNALWIILCYIWSWQFSWLPIIIDQNLKICSKSHNTFCLLIIGLWSIAWWTWIFIDNGKLREIRSHWVAIPSMFDQMYSYKQPVASSPKHQSSLWSKSSNHRRRHQREECKRQVHNPKRRCPQTLVLQNQSSQRWKQNQIRTFQRFLIFYYTQ